MEEMIELKRHFIRERWIEVDMAWHEHIYAMSGNPFLTVYRRQKTGLRLQAATHHQKMAYHLGKIIFRQPPCEQLFLVKWNWANSLASAGRQYEKR
jgi:DNA-binding FadR family transcriptional regulator